MIDSLKLTLGAFQPVGLDEIRGATLMDRADIKFTLHRSHFAEVLQALVPYYSILKVNEHFINPYESVYFDDEKFSLYLNHHNQRSNRYKVRYRKYAATDVSFLEIKVKNSNGRTIKERILSSGTHHFLDEREQAFLSSNVVADFSTLKSNLQVNYSRITLVNKLSQERVTFDLDLKLFNTNREVLYQNVVIAEVKQDRLSYHTKIRQLLKSKQIPDTRVSKYCLGVISLYPNLKSNLFKSMLSQFNKIQYQ